MRSLVVFLAIVACSIAAMAAPSITGATPNPIDANGPFFPLTITGTGFVNGSYARWGSTILTTDYVNSQTLVAEVSSDLRLTSGGYLLTVLNPDKSVSNPYTMVVSPVLASLSPKAVLAGSGPVTLTIKALGPSPRLIAQLSTPSGSINLPCTVVDNVTLTTVIPASALADARAATIQLIDPGSGAVSGTQEFDIRSTPSISGLSPNPVDAGGDYFLLSLTGSDFSPNISVNWPTGAPLELTFFSPTKLQVAITPELRTLSGGFALTVTDHATGVTSNPFPFVVSPVLFSISPASAATGGSALTITATGVGFTANTQLSVTIAGKQTALATTYINSTTLTGVIPASALTSSGSIPIQAIDPGSGGHSLTQTLNVAKSVPSLSAILPSGVTAGSGGFTLTVTGSNFAAGMVVLWNGSPLPTTLASSTQMTAAVAALLVQTPGTASVVVLNGSNAQSGPATFTIHAPAPVLQSIAPISAIAGSGSLSVTFTGANCAAGCTAQWNGTPLAAASLTAGGLTATVPASLTAAAGTVSVRLVNSEGAASNTLPFVLYPGAATLTGITPASITDGDVPVTLTVNGAGFPAGATVQWNGSPLATTFLNSTQLTAVVPASLFNGLLSAAVTVMSPGGAVSNSVTIAINAPQPAITSLSPASIAAGGPAFVLTVTGKNFAVNCVLRWNGTPLYTILVSSTEATATVPANLIASGGSAAITLANPSGLQSGSAAFTIATPAPRLDSIDPPSAPAGAAGLTLSITGANFLPASTVLWRGVPLPTTFLSATQIKTDVAPDLLSAPALVSVTVSNSGVLSANILPFTIGDPVPITSSAGIVNAGSSSAAISPGSLISIYGANLAPASATAPSLPLPASLNGTSVTVNGIAAPLFFVSGGQINAQVPFEAAPGVATLTIQAGTLKSAPVSVSLQPIAPGVLPVVVNCADGSANSPANPAQPGQYITIWVTGQGALDRPIADGDGAPADPIAEPVGAVEAKLEGQSALITFAGMAPGMAGLMQVNLMVPDLPAGVHPLVISVGGVASNSTPVSVVR